MAVPYTKEELLELFTPDEDFENLTDQDNTTELIGSVVHIIAPTKVGKTGKSYDLFKFVLSNGRNCRLMCLIWGLELIEKYQKEITIGRVIHIDGASTKAAYKNNEKISLNVLPFEIVIQKSTTLEFLGDYSILQNEAPSIEVTFETIKDAIEKKIVIKGYVKTKFTNSSTKYENVSYGCGAITDGTYKITVQIGNYVPLNIDKGIYVQVEGIVINKDGLLKISCKNSADIIPINGHDVMTADKLIRGSKQVIVKRNFTE